MRGTVGLTIASGSPTADAVRKDTWVVVLVALALASLGFALSHRAILATDGHMYLEMARGFASNGTLEVHNGLDIHDSNDLVLTHSIKRGAHLYAKYPPLIAPIAALPVVWFGLRGLYLLDAIGLFAAIIVFHRLALRVLSRRRALGATLAMPIVAPVFPYALMELPHLVSAALALGGVLACLRAIEEKERRRAIGFGLLCGVLVGTAIGVRLQEVFFASALVPALWLFGRHRVAVVAQLGGLLSCACAIAIMNHARFGSFNPLSYGPIGVPGGPPPHATPAHVFQGGFIVAFAILGAALLLARFARRLPPIAVASAVLAIILTVSFVPVAHLTLAWMGKSAFGFLVNTNGFFRGWNAVATSFAWFDKPLLQCSPLLVVGLIACVIETVRAAPPVIRASAWICLSTLAFMSTLNPDPGSDESVMGYLSLSPRYLAEIMPLLFLLTAWTLRTLTITRAGVLAASVAGGIVAVLFVRTHDDFDPPRGAIILYGSGALALVICVLTLARHWRGATPLLASAALFGALYGASSTLAIDTVGLFHLGANAEHWTELVLAQTPDRFVLVGWRFHKDGVLGVREQRNVVIVDAAYEDGSDLSDTLAAFRDTGWPIYWVSSEMERVMPKIEPDFDPVPVPNAPLLWKLEPRHANR